MKYHQPRHTDVPTIVYLLHCILTLETASTVAGVWNYSWPAHKD